MRPEEELLAAEALHELRNPDKMPILSPDTSMDNLSSPLCSPRSSASFSSFDRDFAPPIHHRAPPQRSMIGKMFMTATSMLISRDAQRRLRTFVRMLRLANDSLSRKVVALKEAMDQESKGVQPELSANALRQDVVATVKKSTSLIGTVAGNSLPDSARFAVRKLVLTLPAQWRAQQQQQGVDVAAQSAVLSLANETLHLIRDVITIVDDTLDRAESWCGTLGRRSSTESTPDMDSLALQPTKSGENEAAATPKSDEPTTAKTSESIAA